VCLLQFGDIPLLPRVPDQPLLPSARPATLTDLCSFFVTVSVGVSDGSTTVTSTSHSSSSMHLIPATSQNLPRARSAPNVSLVDSHSPSVWASELKDDSVLSPMEYIEKLVLTDFLEPMPQN